LGRIFWAISRIAVTIAIGLATFWPDHGLLFQAVHYFPSNPAPVAIASLLWVCILALLLPLTRRWFQILTTLCLVCVLLTISFQLMALAPFIPQTAVSWTIIAVAIVFAAIGWLPIATDLWRWAHRVAPVEDAEAYSDL
jgi:hypothetical protein